MKLSLRPRTEPEVNLTSLIDVVLLLLIFFMVSTSFVKQSQIAIRLPEAESTAIVEALIAHEVERGMAPERIVIAGFSMGGAVVINTALHTAHRLAGLMALSTYVPIPSAVEGSAGSRDVPLFMAHGTFDPMLPLQWGQLSAETLKEAGFAIEWHDYPMAHAVCPDEIRDIREWLIRVYEG